MPAAATRAVNRLLAEPLFGVDNRFASRITDMPVVSASSTASARNPGAWVPSAIRSISSHQTIKSRDPSDSTFSSLPQFVRALIQR